MMAAAMYMGTIDPPINPSSNIAFECSRYWLPDLSWGMPADNSSYAEADVGQDNLSTSGPAQSLVAIANSHWKMMAPKKVLENGPGFTPDFDALFTFDALMLKVNSSCSVMDSDIHFTEKYEKHPWAFRASLYPCIKTYGSTITKSMPNEILVSTLPLRRTNASATEVTTTANLTYSLATDSILVDGSWQRCQVSDHFTESAPVPISVNKTLQLYPDEPTTWYPADCVWMLDYVPALALNQFLSWMYDESPLLAITSNTVITSGSIWLKPLYRNGTADIDSVAEYIEGLANAMTAIIRQRGSGRVLGTVQVAQTCIHVKWAWVSLPAGLVGVTILLFACTIQSCRRSSLWDSTRSWRCSSLALLFHGCDDQMR
ncbi:hypothetical protein DL98DRAFT_579065 [Cadophora sp. DSE1049]|nr:hypothetical protein DL98DRAFT_579065 [Cadophora sp. DSE1049]